MADQRTPIEVKPEEAIREAASLAEKIARGTELFSKLREEEVTMRPEFLTQEQGLPSGWRRDPEEYVGAGNIWVSCEPEEPILPGVVDVLGADFIMFASDYPHWDGDWPESTKHLRTRPDISEDDRAKIGGLNALRFYGLN